MTISEAEEGKGEQLALTIEEAGALLGISRTSAYQAARRGEIPAFRVGRLFRVPKAALMKMIEGDKPLLQSLDQNDEAAKQLIKARAEIEGLRDQIERMREAFQKISYLARSRGRPEIEHALTQDQLAELTPREQRILRMRFGSNHTLEEVGKALGVTRERIRQIEAKALQKLQGSTRIENKPESHD